MLSKMKNSSLQYILFLNFNYCLFGQEIIHVEGFVKDNAGYAVPYAAVSIPSKYIGTSTTEDGSFYLNATNSEDFLEVSSIGFLTYKIKVGDFLKLSDKTIELKEDVVSLDEVMLLAPKAYVINAIKSLKKNTLSTRHQLNMLYRRFSTEAGKARFLVEHYINVLDRGAASPRFIRIEVMQGRKSADYRFLKDKYPGHQALNTAIKNPLREGIYKNDYIWVKIGNSSYDGEDIVIIEGKGKSGVRGWLRLYIGIDTFAVYKVESSNLNSLWVYKKNPEGKIVLSYHNRTWNKRIPINKSQQLLYGINNKTVKAAYRHEAFVLGIETNTKKIKVGNGVGYRNDMGDIPVKYNEAFWKNLSIPPETKFYQKNAHDLESIYGVPLDEQFQLAN
tara:strand:- start:6500 stop:7669 length:1170 start_codon:yes stop_codon:yes gene_type:complete